MSQGVAEVEDLRRKLEVAELKLVLEGTRGQKEVEELTEGGDTEKEGRAASNNGAEGETVQLSHRSGRKSRRGED